MASENENGVRAFESGEILASDRRVKLVAGKAWYADAADKSIGITVAAAAAAGDWVGVKLHGFPGTRKVTCSAAVTINTPVYGDADGKVNDLYTAMGELIGLALDTGDGDDSVIEALPENGGAELLYAAVGDSSAGGTSSAAEFTFSNGSLTLPAGEIRTGDVFRIKAKARLDATNGSDTFVMKLKIGTETIATTPNPDAVNGDIAIIDAEVSVNVGGASGFVEAVGTVMNDALVAGLGTPFHKASAAEDLSGAIAIAITGQFDASSAGNTAKLDHFTIERVRK